MDTVCFEMGPVAPCGVPAKVFPVPDFFRAMISCSPCGEDSKSSLAYKLKVQPPLGPADNPTDPSVFTC